MTMPGEDFYPLAKRDFAPLQVASVIETRGSAASKPATTAHSGSESHSDPKSALMSLSQSSSEQGGVMDAHPPDVDTVSDNHTDDYLKESFLVSTIKGQDGNSGPHTEVAKGKQKQVDEEQTHSVESGLPEVATSSLLKVQYLIVGAGTAAFSAMKTIQEMDKKADILLITEEANLPYMRPPLSKELWFSKDTMDAARLLFQDWGGEERDIFFAPPSDYQVVDWNLPQTWSSTGKPKIALSSQVSALDVEAQVCFLKSGRKIKFSKLLLATGGRPRKLPFMKTLPEDLERSFFSTFRKIEDFQRLEQLARSGKRIVVLGGGFLGSELACAMARFGHAHRTSVTQVYPESGNMGLTFPSYLSEWTTARVQEEGVHIVKGQSVVDAKANTANADSIQLQLADGSHLEADHVVVAVGLEPNDEVARQSGLEIDSQRRGIVVNAELETRSNIFAAGDVCSFHDIVLGRRRVEHHDHAILSGRIAGRNMMGNHKPYKHQSMFWSDLGPKIGYEAVGILDASLETVGLWATAGEQDTPAAASKLDPNRSIEPSSYVPDPSIVAESIHEVNREGAASEASGSTSEPSERQKNTYGKGIVFYVRDDKIVGVLLWNLFHRTPIARKIIEEQRSIGDVKELARLFHLHDAEDFI